LASKKRAEKPPREFTKTQLSRWQREKRRQRIILGLAIFVIVAAISTIGTGWYITEYKPLHETVIKVNDTEFDMAYFVKSLKLYGEGQPEYYYYVLADMLVEAIQQNELIRQGATSPPMNLSVSEEEITEEYNNYDPPLTDDYRSFVEARLLAEKIRDEYFAPQIPLSAEQRHIMAMLLESESQANEVRDRLTAGEDFAALAGELSLDTTSKENYVDLGWQAYGVLAATSGTAVIDDYAFGAETEIGVVSQPIADDTTTNEGYYWLVKVVEIDEDRQIEEGDRELLTNKAFNDWFEEFKNNPDNVVESYLDDEKKEWAISYALR